MSWESLRQAVDLLVASDEQELELVFYGGEPLLRFELIRRAVAYVEEVRKQGQRVQFSTLTNGTLIDPQVAEFLAGHDFDVQLSMDGTPEVQALRGEGTFEVLDTLLGSLRGDHPEWFRERVSVSATVLPTTVGSLADCVSYFLAKGVRKIGFSPECSDSSGWRLDQVDELLEQFDRIVELSLRHLGRTGQVPVECLRTSRSPRQRPRPFAMCSVESAEDLTVDVDGSVYGCAVLAESYQEFPSELLRNRLAPLKLGGLSEEGLAERLSEYPDRVLAAEIFHEHDRKYSGYGRCASCEFLEDCLICPISIDHIPGNRDPHRIPDFLCAFSRVSHRSRRQFAAAPSPWHWIKKASSVRAEN